MLKNRVSKSRLNLMSFSKSRKTFGQKLARTPFPAACTPAVCLSGSLFAKLGLELCYDVAAHDTATVGKDATLIRMFYHYLAVNDLGAGGILANFTRCYAGLRALAGNHSRMCFRLHRLNGRHCKAAPLTRPSLRRRGHDQNLCL